MHCRIKCDTTANITKHVSDLPNVEDTKVPGVRQSNWCVGHVPMDVTTSHHPQKADAKAAQTARTNRLDFTMHRCSQSIRETSIAITNAKHATSAHKLRPILDDH